MQSVRNQQTESRWPLKARVELGGFGATGYAPSASFGPRLGLALHGEQFEVGAFVLHALESTETANNQSATFSTLGARVLPCYRLRASAELTSRGCLSFEGAQVTTEGRGGEAVLRRLESTSSYWALGLATGLEFSLFGGFGGAAEFGVALPLLPRRFRFINANNNLHEYPRVATRLDLSLCYSF
jgi:hypothetical protein